MNEINHKLDIPLYSQLVSIIDDNIKNDVWKKGSKIPSERELSEIYNVSRITVRNAISELENQGKLERVHGKGTFVVGNSIIQNLGNVYSFSKEMEKQGRISTVKVINNTVEINDAIGSKLGLSKGSKIIRLKRLRIDEKGTPIMVENTYFPFDKYKFVLEVNWDKFPLYKTLEDNYGIRINKAIETFKACQLRDDEANLLNNPIGYYGLLAKRTSFQDNEVVCYSSIVSSGDVFEFTVKLNDN